MAISLLRPEELTDDQFRAISDLIYKESGIALNDGKKQLVQGRLSKRLRQLGISDFDEYLGYLQSGAGSAEMVNMLDAISTNLTSFFREQAHFDYMAEKIFPRLIKERGKNPNRKIRIWSAGCSTGEEPYSVAIHLNEKIQDLNRWDAAILATDINTSVLDVARRGEYDEARLKSVSPQVRQHCFSCIKAGKPRRYAVVPAIKRLVSYARVNLLEKWPMKGGFDLIFCRNVMIYFDKQTQAKLVNRYWETLNPGGVLFIGHSESLTGVQHKYKYIRPTIYSKD